MFKRITSLLLAVVIMVLGIPVSAANIEPATQTASVEEILSDFHIKSQAAKATANTNSRSIQNSDNNKLLEDTVKTLTDAGYEAYSVTGATFKAVEEALDTDLSAIGLDPNYSYIVVVEGDASNPTTRDALGGSATSSFSHTYEGSTYTMRYLVVTATEDPAYGKTTPVNLLNSSGQDIIERCIDAAIQMTLDSLSGPYHLGTIAGICGLSISNINTSSTMTLRMEGSTNWTRVFTQVLDPADGAWIYGSCVEYVTMVSGFSGRYYSSAANHYVDVPEETEIVTLYSSKFSDHDWRRDKAAYGARLYWTQYDTVGSVRYYHDGKVIITHLENF